jgi:hypothetical protein
VSVSDRILGLFLRNPLAWLLLAAFALAECANIQKGRILDQFCDLTEPHDIAVGHPVTDQEKVDAICIDRFPSPYEDD